MNGPAGPLRPIDARLLPDLLPRRKVVLVMDLVESVRLMAENEVGVIRHWRAFVDHAAQLLSRHGGRLVKSLGDGIMVEFETVPAAAVVALELHRFFAAANVELPAASQLHLRAAIHLSDVYVDGIDIYGSGVNLAARLATLGGPGDTIVTAEGRDQLTDGPNGRFEDLGECFLKHVQSPVRAFRLREQPRERDPGSLGLVGELLPAIAVIPFTALGPEAAQGDALGDAIADDIIAALSRSSGLRVISRLSAAPLRRQDVNLADVRRFLGAAYVVVGSYAMAGEQAHVRVQLCATLDGQVLWSDALSADVDDIFRGQDPLTPAVAANVGRVVVQRELERTRALPVSNLESYTLFVGSVSMLHRSSFADFQRARDLLEHLSHRHPGRPAPYALLGKWHLMRMLQGWSTDPAADGREAGDLARRALRCDPEDAFALATQGFLAAHFQHDLQLGRDRCGRALALDPQEPQVWRMRAAIHSYQEEGEQALACAMRALSHTPLDPTRFLYELVVGASLLACGRSQDAVLWADRSLRSNVMHLPTHRLKVIALQLAGNGAAARDAAAALLRLNPHYGVETFARTYPGRDYPHARDYARALREAGIPG